MILKQLIKYDNAPCLEATWVDENDVVIKCHAYSNGQMDMLRADLGADAAAHEELITFVESTYEAPMPEPLKPIKLSSLKFLDLFTEEEQIAVASAAMSNVQAKLWYDRTLAAEYIDISDPRTKGGLEALVSMGLISTERKDQIESQMYG